jgi:hypothetical protein
MKKQRYHQTITVLFATKKETNMDLLSDPLLQVDLRLRYWGFLSIKLSNFSVILGIPSRLSTSGCFFPGQSSIIYSVSTEIIIPYFCLKKIAESANSGNDMFLGGGRSVRNKYCSVPFRSNLRWKNMANENYHHGNSMSLVLFLLMTYCCFFTMFCEVWVTVYYWCYCWWNIIVFTMFCEVCKHKSMTCGLL